MRAIGGDHQWQRSGTLLQRCVLEDAVQAEEIFSTLMGEDVAESRQVYSIERV